MNGSSHKPPLRMTLSYCRSFCVSDSPRSSPVRADHEVAAAMPTKSTTTTTPLASLRAFEVFANSERDIEGEREREVATGS